MSRNITEYDIINSYGAKNLHSALLTERIRNAMQNGWQPFGNVYQDGGILYQPVVKYEDRQRVTAYRVVSRGDVGHLEHNVAEEMRDGWVPYGTASMYVISGGHTRYVQTMVKYGGDYGAWVCRDDDYVGGLRE